MFETEGFHSAGIAGSDFQKTVEAQTPLGRIGQPADIGPVAVFLASEDARWVTGQALLVSGGHQWTSLCSFLLRQAKMGPPLRL